MDKREQIERALKAYFPRSIAWSSEQTGRVYDALAGQAIVIECEVEHDVEHIGNLGSVEYGTWVRFNKMQLEPLWLGSKLEGTPGKALAIIVPLEEE